MSLQTLNLILSNSTDAKFRAWGSAISTAIQAVGLVQTSDTGQVNWTTVTTPVTGNGGNEWYSGYEIYRFADTLQTTTPCFLKIEYGLYNSANVPALQFTISSSTNGAGVMTGQLSEIFTITPNSYSDTVTAQCIIAGSTNRLQIVLLMNNFSDYSGGNSALFSIERDKDTGGSDTALGFFVIAHAPDGRNRDHRFQFIPRASLGVPQGSTVISFATGNQTNGVYGTNVGLFPIYPTLGYLLNPAMGALVYYDTDITDGTVVSVNIYGAAHTYWCLGTHCSFSGSLSLAVRYE